MKQITETQTSKRQINEIIDWGDQVDVVVKCEPIKVDQETLYEITFIRCTRAEYEAAEIETLKEKAQTQNYADIEFLQKKIENQSKVIELLVEILEDENE